jgi:MFS family permease
LKSDVHIDEANLILFNCLLYKHLKMILKNGPFVRSVVLNLIRYIFSLGGVVYLLYLITMNGVLLEISGNENRAIYTGFTGAGNILPAVFPLIGGWIIAHWGFGIFSILIMLIVSSSVFFIRKIDCNK